MKLAKNQVHVYFYALPIGTKFIHKDEEFEKITAALSVDNKGRNWGFEGHYGCVISKTLADQIGIKKADHRPYN